MYISATRAFPSVWATTCAPPSNSIVPPFLLITCHCVYSPTRMTSRHEMAACQEMELYAPLAGVHASQLEGVACDHTGARLT